MKNKIKLILKVIVSIIFIQTLFFKFTASPESVYIFSKLGVEPYGRIGAGIVELISVILLFAPGLSWIGAGLAFGTMAGAVISHLFILGIEIQGDGGLLFYLGVISAAFALVILFLEKEVIFDLYKSTRTRFQK
jgi:hypothetical protein